MFATVVGRNRATAFTSAMFIENVQHAHAVDYTKYPMAMKGVITALCAIITRYDENRRSYSGNKRAKTRI